MTKKNLSLIAFILIVVVVIFFDWKSTNYNISSIVEKEKKFLPMTQEQENYLKESQDAVKKINEIDKNLPNEIKENMKRKALKILSISDAMIQSVTFYGRVVDQHSKPVSGVEVLFDGGGSAYTFGSGPDSTTTNDQGVFTINNARAYNLGIEAMKKEGYDFGHIKETFRSYNDPNFRSWNDYNTLDNPYLFEAWKVEKYEKVFSSDFRMPRFESGQVYTLDLLNIERRGKIKHKGETTGDIRVLFEVDGNDWVLTLFAVDGGLIESADKYLNLAPESGYKPMLKYDSKTITGLNKKYYFTSRDRTVYGALNIEISPYNPKIKNRSALRMTYVVNLEKGRNLTVKQ
jgi:hypothetical protein